MQEDLHAKVAKLENLLAIQKASVTNHHTTFSDYMVGMYNGLLISHSIFIPASPKFIRPPTRRVNRVRHRIKK